MASPDFKEVGSEGGASLMQFWSQLSGGGRLALGIVLAVVGVIGFAICRWVL